MLLYGDALTELQKLPSDSVDAICCDPPSGIAFMSKKWDTDKGGRTQWVVWLAEIMTEALRVLKPGGHAVVWALPRTSHWTACALEDAGFEIRDCLYHFFGSGFPKSHNVSIAIDKHLQVEREVIGEGKGRTGTLAQPRGGSTFSDDAYEWPGVYSITSPGSIEAQQYDGYGTALKPGVECWWLCRKPLEKGMSIAENVLKWGTGGLNISVCRVGDIQGRWPANLLLSHSLFCTETCIDDCPVKALDEQSGTSKSVKNIRGKAGNAKFHGDYNNGKTYLNTMDHIAGHSDQGGASRYFTTFRYTPKASRRERDTGCARNTHPTVKPVTLMRWLLRLITPPGGVVLDMFMGSGTTGVAALLEGMNFIGIEQEEEYFSLARLRLASTRLAAG